jgi:hypothetical protein
MTPTEPTVHIVDDDAPRWPSGMVHLLISTAL